MAENFYDLLPFDHLFDVAVHLGKRILARFEIAPAAPGNGTGNQKHHSEHRKCDEREKRAKHDHHEERANDADRRADKLRNALAEHFAHGVDVVGVGGHDFAMGARVKIADGELLHVRKKLFPQLQQRSGRDCDHQPVVEVGASHADRIDCKHDGKLADQAGKSGSALPIQGTM